MPLRIERSLLPRGANRSRLAAERSGGEREEAPGLATRSVHKLGLFVAIVGLGLVAEEASAKLARETGMPTLLISVLAGIVGHGLAGEL